MAIVGWRGGGTLRWGRRFHSHAPQACSRRALLVRVGAGATAGAVVVALHAGSSGKRGLWSSAVVQAEAAVASAPKTHVFTLAGSGDECSEGSAEHSSYRLLHTILGTLRIWLRFGFLTALSASVIIPSATLYVLPSWTPARAWLSELCWNYALWSIELAGPTYVKLGQWAATRPDMFPEEFCHRFSRLHDQVAAHAWQCTVACLDRTMGQGWEQKLVLDQKVIGSGCIAQVYQGQWFGESQTTTGDQRQEVEEGKGVKVAVKVCHPNIRGKVQSDLAILKWACAQLEWWLPQTAYLGTLDVMADFEQLMRRQMDLRLEAHNLLRFRENFAEERSLDVSFPEPLWYESSEVLVEGFMEGLPIYKFIHGTQYTAEHKRKIADAGIVRPSQDNLAALPASPPRLTRIRCVWNESTI